MFPCTECRFRPTISVDRCVNGVCNWLHGYRPVTWINLNPISHLMPLCLCSLWKKSKRSNLFRYTHGELMARLIDKMDKLFQRFVDTCCWCWAKWSEFEKYLDFVCGCSYCQIFFLSLFFFSCKSNEILTFELNLYNLQYF